MTGPGHCARCGAVFPPGRFQICPACLLDPAEGDLAPVSIAEGIDLIEQVGRGGMGTVYRAHDRRLDRMVAVKLLSEGATGAADLGRRLEREARTLARLQHPNIVAVHAVGDHGGRPYIVMELVEGRPLSECLSLPIERAAAVAYEVAEALAHAHSQGVVHRDVKPQNVMIAIDGRVKVTDFGIARIVSADAPSSLTRPGEVFGTPQFLAPEALANAPPHPSMDVYSLGALLYAMVRGQPPVGDFDPLPGALDGVVRRALAPDPERRTGSVEEFQRELMAAVGPRERARAEAAAADLPADEGNWLLAVALLLSLASAAWIWALLASLTPRVVDPATVGPLVVLAPERLPDGRLVSRARFETVPILAGIALTAVALAAHGALRRHWRLTGVEVQAAERPVPRTGAVLALGGLSVALFALRRFAQARGLAVGLPYMPVLGGLLEVAILVLGWTRILEAWRTGRPLAREGRLWLGLMLALVPPVFEFLSYLRNWRP